MDVITAIVNVLDRVFDDMKDDENRLYTEQLMSEEFVKELREELIGMMKEGDGVRVSEITQFFKHKYKGYLYNFLGRGINSPVRNTGYKFTVSLGGSVPSYVTRITDLTKEDWRKKAGEDFIDTSDELMALQQLLFYMEELLKMLRQPEPDIPEIIRFLEYNVETMREEYT